MDQSFNKGMEKYTKLEQAHLHQKVETIKERGGANEEALMQYKDQGRKVELQRYVMFKPEMFTYRGVIYHVNQHGSY